MSIWFKGEGTGEKFNVYVSFGETKPPEGNWVVYSFWDVSPGWQRIVFSLSEPVFSHGEPLWDQVSYIAIDSPNRNFSGSFSLGPLSFHKRQERQWCDELIRIKERASISYKSIESSYYKVCVTASKPYTLVMFNTYHPLWRAFVNGVEYRPISSYYGVTAFQIDQTGEQEVIIKFTGQKYQTAGLLISGLTYLGSILWLGFPLVKKGIHKFVRPLVDL